MMIQKTLKYVFMAFLILALGAQTNNLRAEEPNINTTAEQAIVVDSETGMVLMEKDADQRMPTSSMSKVMTMYMIFDAIKRGDLKPDDKLLVSEKAWRKGGSKMFVEVDKYVKVKDLIHGVVVQSGNDATIVLAEGLAGNEDAFAEAMNVKAAQLGMDNSHFMNASGWPNPDHYSTARDLATMAVSIIRDHPEFLDYTSRREFTFNNITQKNRKPLLYRDIGADGMKTGHTEAGGYGLIGTGEHDGRRVVVVLNGMKDEKERARQSAKLLEWGLKRFENRTIFKAGETITQAPVIMGRESSVPLTLKQDLRATLPKLLLSNYKVVAKYKSPLVAPISNDDPVGELHIEIPTLPSISAPLYTAGEVEEQGFFNRTISKMKLFLQNKV